MADQIVEQGQTTPLPTVLGPEHVSAEEYLEKYAHRRYEYVEGRLIKLAASTDRHFLIEQYLSNLIQAYLSLRPIGQLRGDPLIIRLDEESDKFRIPDLQVILDDGAAEITETQGVSGPADIIIEIVSEESVARDHGEKFEEYEKGGVREYWIIDPLRNQCRFNRLQDDGKYRTIHLEEAGEYTPPLLPDLVIDVATLWQDQMPDVIRVVEAVRAMLSA